MKTIISAKFGNAGKTAVILTTDPSGTVLVDLASPEDNSGGWRVVYQGWHGTTQDYTPTPIDPIEFAEAHIEKFFSTAKLLQMKVWLDLIPHESTPKLMSVFEWSATVTSLALSGSTELPVAPVIFLDVAQECIPLLLNA